LCIKLVSIKELLFLSGFEPQTVQPTASHYTDYLYMLSWVCTK